VFSFLFSFTQACEKKPPERTFEFKKFWALLKGGENWSTAILAVGRGGILPAVSSERLSTELRFCYLFKMRCFSLR
jgi:hypothetical protein